jgi:acyl carrier protein
MDSSAIINDLNSIFSDVLDLPDLQLKPETTAADVEGWDSLAHINLVLAIERHYKIKFALGELQDLRNLGEMVQLIQRKTGNG